jgi:hypothetical protein
MSLKSLILLIRIQSVPQLCEKARLLIYLRCSTMEAKDGLECTTKTKWRPNEDHHESWGPQVTWHCSLGLKERKAQWGHCRVLGVDGNSWGELLTSVVMFVVPSEFMCLWLWLHDDLDLLLGLFVHCKGRWKEWNLNLITRTVLN